MKPQPNDLANVLRRSVESAAKSSHWRCGRVDFRSRTSSERKLLCNYARQSIDQLEVRLGHAHNADLQISFLGQPLHIMGQATSKMTTKTKAEALFEEFCNSNNIVCEKVIEDAEPTPDYRVVLNGQSVVVEVKQIDEDDGFRSESGVSTRTVGSHIRNKIHEVRKRKQLKAAANLGIPAILLVYNNLDPNQEFGNEPHDFIAAMYGELTVVLNPDTNRIIDSYHGRNRSFAKGKNTSISAVGCLYRTAIGLAVRVYENVFCDKNRLDFSLLPDCIEVTRIDLV